MYIGLLTYHHFMIGSELSPVAFVLTEKERPYAYRPSRAQKRDLTKVTKDQQFLKFINIESEKLIA